MTDYARAALLAVVEHWPGRLDDLALQGHMEIRRPGLAGVTIWRGSEGLLVHFTHEHLHRDSPLLRHAVQAAYWRGHSGTPAPDPTPDHPRAALRVLIEHWPATLDGVTLTASLMRSAAAGVVVQQDGRSLQVGFDRDDLDRTSSSVATTSHVALAYRAWTAASDRPEPRQPPYAP
jgi:hypothetical protein